MNTIKEIKRDNKILKIVYDDSPESPREWDNLSKMICFHKRYDLGDEHSYNSNDYSGWEEMEQDIIKNEDVAVILPLYLYDHSGITIKVGSFSGLLPQGHAQFDSGQVGFVIVTKEAVKNEFGTKRVSKKQIEKAEKILLAEVETYDQYLRGDVYGFSLFEVEKCDKCNKEEEKLIDSCYGFFGNDFKTNGIAEHIADEELSKALLEEV